MCDNKQIGQLSKPDNYISIMFFHLAFRLQK